MASGKNTRHEQSLLESLRYAAHGINAPFACGATLVPRHPVTICFPDKTQITVSRAKGTYEQEQLLQPLIARCQPAPFGKGRKTLYDRSVRDALQIKAENGAFSVLHFDPAEAGILEQIRRELTPQVPDAPAEDIENALAVRDSAEDAKAFDVIWVDPPPHFNFAPTMYPDGTSARDPDLPAIAHLHSCEYSATGYFGNEGSDIDLYVYGALHVEIPPYGEGARAVTRPKPAGGASSVSGRGKDDHK